MAAVSRLEHRFLDAGDELNDFTQTCAARGVDGAIVAFTGLARDRAKDGARVDELRLDWHPRLTEQSLQRIAQDALDRFPVTAVYVVHRWGCMAPGDTIVFAAAASPHRREAFQAADYLMDRLKSEAVFWKHESGPDGGRWIEPTEQDGAALARWSD